jgi:erythrin-vacuolar iron transport family protein
VIIMQRSFLSLTPQEALQIAISIEERNTELYHCFADLFTEFGDDDSLEIAAVFWEMALEERGHSQLLRQKYAERYGAERCPATEDELIEIIELPRLENADIFAPPETSGSGRTRALKIALQAESGAQRFYAKLAEQTPPGVLHNLFDHLAQMEDGHVGFLTQKLSQGEVEGTRIQ